MQFREKLSDGLKREVEVSFSAQSLLDELNDKISEAKSTVHLKGFRPGKVPESYLRKTYGKSFMAQIINDKIAAIPAQLADKTKEKPAATPEFVLTEDEQVLEKIIKGEEDLVVLVKYEILPEIKLKDFNSYELSRFIVDVPAEEVEKQLEHVLSSTRDFSQKQGAAELGDRVTMDYVGKIDGKIFDNGSDNDAQLILGSKNFIPGFEEPLVGLTSGEEKEITVTFPENYGAAELAGKTANFDIKLKKIESASPLKIDDEAAKKLGVESLDKLKELLKNQLESHYGGFTRRKVKRQILDLLAKDYEFELPEKLVNLEYENVKNHMQEAKEDEAPGEYQQLAERRVRLGLLVAKIAEEAKIDVSKEEMQRAMFQQLQHFPGHEKEMLKLFQNNPDAMASLRAPILEDKVIDHILSQAKVNDIKVTAEELLKEDEAEEPKKSKSSVKKKPAVKKKPE